MDFPPYPGDLTAMDDFFRTQRELYRLSEPREVMVVLGRGTKAEKEVKLAACRKDGIPVLRRKGGGGAVVLAPGTMVITAAFFPRPGWAGEAWLLHLASECREVLADMGVQDLCVQGYGDVCIGDRKILGASLYVAKEVVLYQASLLMDCDLVLIPRYLEHPLREPAYRRGREHLEFVTSLREAGYTFCGEEIRQAFEDRMQKSRAIQGF